MKNFKSLFAFDRKQQRGIFVLMLLLIVVLAVFIYVKQKPKEVLSLKDTTTYQSKVDSLAAVQQRRRDTIYPFNPNYITDYRGYKLGLNVEEIDRLHRFRESGKFINSRKDFQQVTQVSNQWLDSIAPYFKFPDWVTRPENSYKNDNTWLQGRKVVAKDINAASQEELKKVYGIGPALSSRILQERGRLKGFIDISQVRGVYGLTDSTMIQLKKHFYVTPPSGFLKIALNTATEEELLSIPYFDDYLVEKLVEQRTLRDGFKSWDKVMLTSRFPQEKLGLIQLYLSLD
ncbi:competence protein ComEA [Nonlabens sp. MB-3u-79]|jgi:DNA uptake protein ComE-like DNA-binding protein|uniref:helix-hairpin-helix domain-containing protein n=1 Tax=Nonlabens sp. MB-3u-79 TaxID=2058134 RepID=UPI000C2FFDC2|nr:helix-hairpin-helix domain-containing protein [Nonlabens sp. MB-3u-79]AUC78217.1 competence protein ComEA [Nonlabens sp. MB-3u-79]|tara:strand:+ start:17056 stop:17919 length:864 start_codon:yes stop_codon:yes gene_type:complete